MVCARFYRDAEMSAHEAGQKLQHRVGNGTAPSLPEFKEIGGRGDCSMEDLRKQVAFEFFLGWVSGVRWSGKEWEFGVSRMVNSLF